MNINRRIAVVGLGYVGLPIAVSFGRIQPVIGFDINMNRIEELRKGSDSTNEASKEDLAAAQVEYTGEPEKLAEADFIIVTVPTPVDEAKIPDLTPVVKASETVGRHMQPGSIVVYESTVYPGATEEVCIPILERESGLACGKDFKVGYSPERINPGDREHSFSNIVKVVSAQDEETLEIVAEVYSSVVEAGVYRASSIKVAEAAKVIENTQRDLNIALINELALIFHRMGIDTRDVLAAAGTKWNFLPFQPGLVGGHCIGVDPYYLTYKAQELGYIPQVILSGRRINDGMGKHIAEQIAKCVFTHCPIDLTTQKPIVTVLGLTFKENVPDLRNTRVTDLIEELKEYGFGIQVSDAMAYPEEARTEYGIELTAIENLQPANAVVVAVAHDEYKIRGWRLVSSLLADGRGVVADIKGLLPRDGIPEGVHLWRL